MNVDNIIKLAEVLEREETQQHFDLNNWAWNAHRLESFAYQPYDEEILHTCGTVACVAGWAKALFAPKSCDLPFDVGAEVLDLEHEQSYHLFTPPTDEWALKLPPEKPYVYDATARGAAKVLRHLAATGKVDWSKAFDEE
jgi:hypothetical protein